LPFNSVGLALSAADYNVRLPIRKPLFVLVRATNAVGLSTIATSDGFEVLDDSSPESLASSLATCYRL
jgi:hypothetical protein